MVYAHARSLGGAQQLAEKSTMEDDCDTETLKVSALKWLADTGKLELLQQQCSAYTSENETVNAVECPL